MKLSIEQYIITNNPKAVHALIAKYGLPKAKNWADLERKLRFLMENKKETIVDDLRNIDTDYKALILSGVNEVKPIAVEKKSNSCGCSGFDSDESSNCDGDSKCAKCTSASKRQYVMSNAEGDKTPTTETKPVEKSDFNKYAPVVVTVLLGGIFVALIAK